MSSYKRMVTVLVDVGHGFKELFEKTDHFGFRNASFDEGFEFPTLTEFDEAV